MTAAVAVQEENVPKMLRIAKGFALPLETVTQTIAVLARKRSGKSYALRRLAEQLFRAGQQVVDVDPKGDHWGIRYGVDGKSPGLGFIILGGEHGDLPLEVGSGELVAKLVVEERVSVVLDLSHFRKHEVVTFVTAFTEALYRLKAREEYRTPVMVIFDEADIVAPQKTYTDGQERMIGALDDIVRRGGQRGIGCALATQRAAVLNKNILTQAQVLVALRTISPQDRKAMDEWIEVHGEPEQRATLMSSLPSLPKGDAWFWSPGWPTEQGIFERVHVDAIETFDSGKTPEPGEKRIMPKGRADVDLDALRRQMAATVERQRANDPGLLRKRIAELERELAKKPAAAPAPARVETKVVERSVLKAGDLQSIQIWCGRAEKAAAHITDAVAKLAEKLSKAQVDGRPPPAAPGPAAPRTFSQRARALGPSIPTIRREGSIPRADAARRAAAKEAARQASSEGGLDKAQRAVLAVLAQFPEGCPAKKLTLLARYRWSGGFRNALSALRSAGYIEGSNSGVMRATDAGVAMAGEYEPLPTGRALVDYWLNHRSFGASERAVLRVLLEHPEGLGAEDLAKAAGYEWSGGFRNALSSLRTAGVIVGRNTEVMRACDELLAANDAR